MVTGMKCSELEENEEEDEEEKEEEEEELEYDWGDVENGHTPSDLLNVLSNTDETEENKDERFCLAMLILIESLVIPSYPWGRDSYIILLNSVKKLVPTRLRKSKYDIHDFPIALNLWMLESVPQLQHAFSSINSLEAPTAFLCEKYLRLTNPTTSQVVAIEGFRDLRVVCVLPSIPSDPEDKVFLEDQPGEDLNTLAEIIRKGYKMKIEDWETGTIDILEAIDQIAQQPHRFGVVARAGPSNAGARAGAGDGSTDESLKTKLDLLYNMVKVGLSDINIRLSNIEEKMGIKQSKTDGEQQNTFGSKSPSRDAAQPDRSNEEVMRFYNSGNCS
ncbi:hypothetical protein EUTSA_v10003375mg [Eutrema salsugineum]|uniref:DUF1985 domain-containing protein n=1 Tax=Eutrema salsugineum TaxID=72664 RepID=V4LXX3_EUTSA|nr:hypothetical protein EUTSA_v10003375mg [Eutrema salsugineum]